jgi:hypothetical protein
LALSRYDGELDQATLDASERLQQHSTLTSGSSGHVLKAAGRQPESIEAYRKATQLEPKIGEAWWSLANLKTVKLSADDIRAMTAQLDRSDLTDDDRLHFEFSLGKAHEDLAQFDTSFRHYDAGNRLRLRMAPYDAESSTVNLRRSQSTYTRDFFEDRRDCGASSIDAAPCGAVCPLSPSMNTVTLTLDPCTALLLAQLVAVRVAEHHDPHPRPPHQARPGAAGAHLCAPLRAGRVLRRALPDRPGQSRRHPLRRVLVLLPARIPAGPGGAPDWPIRCCCAAPIWSPWMAF